MSSSAAQPDPWPWTNSKAKVLLQDDAQAVNIRITDISKEKLTSTLYTTPSGARAALSLKPADKAKLRIISIHSKKTISPLDITNDLLVHLFREYNVHTDFADIVASFGQEPNLAEGSSNHATLYTKQSGHCDLAYQIRYVERNQRGGKDPWSRRHSGVYHHHSSQDGMNVVVLLHPVREPLIEKSIQLLKNDLSRRSELCDNPFLLHAWMFAQYFGNWRWYFRDLGDRFAEENNLAMVVQPQHADPLSSFDRVQRLRNTMDLILFARACCSGNLELVHRLSNSSLESLRSIDGLEAAESKLKGYIESADVTKGRVQNLIDLVGYTLTLHNQLEAAKIDTELRNLTKKMKELTQDTVDDSATVKIITFVSAIYLPGSFIATLFGMNFFLFNPASKQLEISPNFWIFVATWLPLVFITGGIYVLILFFDAKMKGRPFRMPWRKRSAGQTLVPYGKDDS